MTFDYRTLSQAARSGQRLGNWNGKAVFAASANDLDNKGSGAFYILYDDENKIVARVGNGWKSFGEVSEAGSVNEYNTARNYNTAAEAAQAARKAKTSTSGMRYSSEPIPQATMKVCGVAAHAPEGSYTPGYDVSERPTGDVKLEIDVDAVLKKARETSIDDLLDGFMVGILAKG